MVVIGFPEDSSMQYIIPALTNIVILKMFSLSFLENRSCQC